MTRGGYTQEGRTAGRKAGQGVFGRIDAINLEPPGELFFALTLAIIPFLPFVCGARLKLGLSSSCSHFLLFNYFKTSDVAVSSTCEL